VIFLTIKVSISIERTKATGRVPDALVKGKKGRKEGRKGGREEGRKEEGSDLKTW
jgi:hypothetical protein